MNLPWWREENPKLWAGCCDYCGGISEDLEPVDQVGTTLIVACRECRERDTAYQTERAMDEAESTEER